MNQLSFDQLPAAVAMLTKEISEIKSLLLNRQATPFGDQQEKLLSVQDAARFLNLSVATIYGKVSKGELPVMKQGNRLYFTDSELMAYLKDGRKITYTEAEGFANQYLSTKKSKK